MLRRWLTVLLAVVTALVAASPASASTHLGPQTRVGAFELAAHTLVGPAALRTPENRRAKSLAKPVRASDPRLRWKGRPFLEVAGGVYDMRARWWSPRLGAFLSADNFGYADASSTLWGWGGQNPIKWADPSGRYVLTPAALAALEGAAEAQLPAAAAAVEAPVASAAAAAGVASGLAAAAIAAPAIIAGAVIAHDWYAFKHPTISHADPDASGGGGSCSASGGGSMGGGGGGPPQGPPTAPPGGGDDDDDAQPGPTDRDAEMFGILRDAANGQGNFGLGDADAATAAELGEAWAGENPRVGQTGKGGDILISQDGLRQYRAPSWKPNLGRVQANFQSRPTPSGPWINNGHLNITFGP